MSVVIAVGLLVGAGMIAVIWAWPAQPRGTVSVGRAAPHAPWTGTPGERLDRLAGELAPALAASREVLLGKRDPRQYTCVRQYSPTDGRAAPLNVWVDPNGGPGTSLGCLRLMAPRPNSVKKDYDWRQTTLRGALVALRQRNLAALGPAESLSREACRFADDLDRAGDVPAGVAEAAVPPDGSWCDLCAHRVREAIARRDLAAARRWADELAAATFALADLHRWLAFLLDNNLASLDFQAMCQEAFEWADPLYGDRYQPVGSHHSFPGMSMLVDQTDNYLEVERQAEGLFQTGREYSEPAMPDTPCVPAAVWMPPAFREAFGRLRSRLSQEHQRLWDQAASSPYERSYLANILFRASQADALGPLGVVLWRFSQDNPQATVADLMDVMFHRGGAGSSGLDWADRFDERLMQQAGQMQGTAEQVLRHAHSLTNGLFGGWQNYAGKVFTLRQALDTGKLDCIRGSDMIGSLFRNAGHAGYYAVRVSCATDGHSLAAAEIADDEGPRIAAVDSLRSDSRPVAWPSAFFGGLSWPEGYPGPRGPAFSAELTARGLDNYILVEGYIIRGRHAGTLVRAAVPYMPGRDKPSAEKVHDGPYPEIPPPSGSPFVPRGQAGRDG